MNLTDSTQQKVLVITSFILIAVTLAHYWYTLDLFLLNAPDSDDYVDIFWFFEIWLSATTINEKMYALFLPVHEHITAASHVIYALHHTIFNTINFAHYILIGQLILVAICITLASIFSKKLSWPVSLAIAFLYYFNLSYWHSSFWAMTAISNQLVILFALLAARSFYFNPDNLTQPILFAIAGCFSQSNGLAILPGLLLALSLSNKRNKKPIINSQTILISGLFISILAIHILHQNPFHSDHHLDHQALTTEPELIHLYQRDISNTNRFTFSPLRAFYSFLIISGASSLKNGQQIPAALFGLLIAICWLYLFIKRKEVNSFVVIALSFTCISILLIALGRGSFSIELATMQSRYRMYSFLLLALTAYQLLLITQHKKIILPTSIALACILQIISRQHIDAMVANQHMLTSSYYHWLIDGGFGRSTMPIYPPNQDRRLSIAYKEHRYNPMSAIPKKHKLFFIQPDTSQNERCPALKNRQPTIGTIQAYSKKPTANASEITITVEAGSWVSTQPTQLLFCGDDISTVATIDSTQMNPALNQPWPILIEKTYLPRGNYSVYLSQNILQGALGVIFIK